MEYRILTDEENRLCIWNLLTYKSDFKICSQKCKNCLYPMSALDGGGFYSIYSEGLVCEACHVMENSVANRMFFKTAHEEWKKDQRNKKRMTGENDYFSP